jgi:hypothetical protein
LDGSETLKLITPSGTRSCLSGELCGFTNDFGFPTPIANLSFNIYDQDGVTLSDTLSITNSPCTDCITTVFQSDVEGTALVPFRGGTKIIEDGTLQTAATIPLPGAGMGNFVVKFQSDVAEVPEPSSITLLILVLVGVAVTAKQRLSNVE